jgi:hypothetical protein
MILPQPSPLQNQHAFGVDDDGALVQLLFSVLFLEWVTSVKRYWITFA